ncbi:MAG: tRNA uridine-5-carboxymethylaminomethyl(34) synthesis enzyme MnmG [Clostridiales bacterium]|jgi:tRNA uridine 5-carboxymethylaminomethyl modification enzyme|nr:tRNA uridine-5-carboxymethylaminomethyl(34) synthesis enzyme MnmG [Clostridiales bacterium]
MSDASTVAVIGGGHAGCEAALSVARLGFKALVFVVSLDSIAMMPCNPCIGGSAKGHLVREIDALGGQMGKTIDASFLQSRMLNAAKGPAVYSLRAQADKQKYMAEMKKTLESEPNIYLRQNEIIEILTAGGSVTGVKSESGAVYPCGAVIVCAGTYLESRCLYGETVTHTGPNGLRAARGLSACLRKLGFDLMRFKTGTPARVHRRSLDFEKMEIQPGDGKLVPFSFETDPAAIARPQIPCYLTYTNPKTHEIIRGQIHRSPMYSGVIEGTGTRYCPSIEDKVMRFADKERHPVFIEPEGENTEEMYVQGMSSSLPEDAQIAAYRTVPGLERCEFMRNAYAIEYDCIDATGLKLNLEAKNVRGLFFAGQVNGSSGYEEAAAQGLMAGINAALSLRGKEPLILDRAESYIGVLIDDLVTKGSREPYRMMTSRAEYRLLLRQDNADLRLTEKGYGAGLIPGERYGRFLRKKEWIEAEVARVAKATVAPEAVNEIIKSAGGNPVGSGVKLADLIKRPELSYDGLSAADPSRPSRPAGCAAYVWDAVREQVNIHIKYEGYIKIQTAQAAAFRKSEGRKLPADLPYGEIAGLRLEARQKLAALRPENLGQASRITGVSPADIQVLLVFLKYKNLL